MIRALEENDVDLVLASLTQTPERAKVVNYMPTVAIETYALFLSKSGKNTLIFLPIYVDLTLPCTSE